MMKKNNISKKVSLFQFLFLTKIKGVSKHENSDIDEFSKFLCRL